MKEKNIIVVLSMGRSGSSAITRSLKILGVDLGDHLLRSLPEINPTGLWEDLEIEAFNDKILWSLNSRLGQISLITQEMLENDIPTSFKNEAKKILINKFKHSDTFGFKDNRTTTLIHFWKKIFKELSIKATYIIAARHPVSTAISHLKISNDHYFEEKTYIRWLQHMTISMLETEGENRTVVDYDLLMKDPASQIHHIADAIGSNPSINKTALDEYCSNFLTKDLRHNESSMKDLKAIPFAPNLIYPAYEILLNIAKGKISAQSPEIRKIFLQCSLKLEQLYPTIQTLNEIESTFLATHNKLEQTVLKQFSRSISLTW